MIILGVDPGTRIAGFAILKHEKQMTYLVACGHVTMPAARPLQERVSMFYDAFQEKINTYGVTHLALETPFLGKNAQNFLKLGYVRGILYLLAHKHNLVLQEFSPTQVKAAVTGYGGASKEQVGRVMLQLFPSLKAPDKEDATDALAVSLCGLWQGKQNSLLTSRSPLPARHSF